ncbi:MAG: hypothetical protein JSR82_20095 [Verrucomicrobia bacterium]|nr:hypothetical protein [Verrucomicrobiota bacterium]
MSWSRFILPASLVAGGVVAGVVLDRTIGSPGESQPPPAATAPAAATARESASTAAAAPAKAKAAPSNAPVDLASALQGAGPHRRRTIMAGLLSSLNVAELEKAIEELRTNERFKIWSDPEAASLLIGRLAELDATRALILASARNSMGFPDGAVLRSVLEALAETRPDAVLAWLRTLPNDRFRRSAVGTWLGIVSKSDPEGALAWAMAEKVPASELSGLFAKLAERDAMNAVTRAAALPAGEQRRAALNGAVQEWAKTDPGAAMAWIRSRPADRLRGELVTKAMAGFAEVNPSGAAAYVLSSLEPREKADAARVVAENWMQLDFAAAKGWVEQLPKELAREVGPRILGTWSDRDPAGAVAFVWKNQTDGGRGEWALRGVMSEWAARDFDAAKNWVLTLAPGPMRDAVLSGLLTERRWGGGGADIDPRAALDLIVQLGGADSEARRNAMSEQMQRWARDDFEAAALWARNQPDRKLANELLGGALRELASYDPQRAVRTLPTLSTEAQLSAGKAIAESWAQLDPAAAARWVATWPPTEASLEASREIAARWARQDATAALAWLQTQTPEFLAQSVSPRVIGPLASSDVGSAQRLVERMPQGQARDQAAETLVRVWSRTDTNAAQAWVQQTSILSPEQRQRLQTPNPPRRGGR